MSSASASRFEWTMVRPVSTSTTTSVNTKNTMRSGTGRALSASRFMPRKPVVTVPIRPKIVTTVSRTTVLAWRRRLSASR